MAEPLFLTKSRVNDESVFSTVSHGASSISNAVDRDKDSLFLTSGAASDATLVTIVAEFYEGTTAVERTISRLILLNKNVKRFTLFYWDGAAWQSLGQQTDVDDHFVQTFGQVTTGKIKLEIDQTIVADQEKSIGEIIVCDTLLAPARDVEASYNVRYRERSREVQLGSGAMHKMVTRWAPNRTQRYEARAQFNFVSEADRLLFKALRDLQVTFLWQPESTYRPEELYLVRWTNPWDERYTSSNKGAGSEISLELKEV